MTRVAFTLERFTGRELVLFVRSRIPPEHRSCWSVSRTKREMTGPTIFDPMTRTWQYGARQPAELTFWFAKRYRDIAFEMKMNFG